MGKGGRAGLLVGRVQVSRWKETARYNRRSCRIVLLLFPVSICCIKCFCCTLCPVVPSFLLLNQFACCSRCPSVVPSVLPLFPVSICFPCPRTVTRGRSWPPPPAVVPRLEPSRMMALVSPGIFISVSLPGYQKHALYRTCTKDLHQKPRSVVRMRRTELIRRFSIRSLVMLSGCATQPVRGPVHNALQPWAPAGCNFLDGVFFSTVIFHS